MTRGATPDPDAVPRPGAGARLAPDTAEQLADTLFALAATSRLQILACLSDGPLSVSEIVERVAMEQSAVSHQLRVLREHDVVDVERRGRTRLYRVRTPHIAEVLERAHAHVDALRGGGRASAGETVRRAS